MVAGLAAMPQAAVAMAGAKPATRASAAVLSGPRIQIKVPSAASASPKEKIGLLKYYESQQEEEEDDDSDFEDDADFFSSFLGNIQDEKQTMDAVKQLQKSTGSEILSAELQQQIDSASLNPNMFLDAHVADASLMEKVAMSSIPQQLPRPAVDAFTHNLDKKLKKLGPTHSSAPGALNGGRTRVTHEQELELGRMIQRGVALHKLKADFEGKEGREITRQEWTEIAELDSPKDLRRQVAAYRRAKQLLVSANMGLVHAVVNKSYGHVRKATGLIKDELIQEGCVGLLRAAELFDPSRGLRFSTYATIWIKGHLQNSHITDGSITLPQREKSKWNKIVKAHEELTKLSRSNSEPTVEEIAHHLNMDVAEVLATKRKMSQAQRIMSLDYEYAAQTRSGTDGGTTKPLENDRAMQEDADLAERTQMHADVVAALVQNLDAREARLMRLRYGLADGKTRSLKECAEAMGLGETRVQQLANQCLKKLRKASEMESLEEYLLTVA